MSGTTNPHGSLARYAKDGCRCPACRASKAAYERGKRRTEAEIEGRTVRTIRRVAEHGTRARYNHYACRCDPCRWANAQASAAFRARRVPGGEPL